MDKVVKRFNMIMNGSIFMLLIDLIVGCVLVLCTDLISKVVGALVGSVILIHGLFNLFRYFYDGLGNRIFFPELVSGVVGIILGVFMMLNVKEALSIMGFIFGIWIISYGLEKLFYAVKFMKAKEEIFPLMFFISILFIVMGLLAIINPFEMFVIITKLVGLFMCAYSLLDVMTCMLFKRRSKQILKLFE